MKLAGLLKHVVQEDTQIHILKIKPIDKYEDGQIRENVTT